MKYGFEKHTIKMFEMGPHCQNDKTLNKNNMFHRAFIRKNTSQTKWITHFYLVNCWADTGLASVTQSTQDEKQIAHLSPTSLFRTEARPDPLFVLCEVKLQKCLCKCHAKHLVQPAFMISSDSHANECNWIKKIKLYLRMQETKCSFDQVCGNVQWTHSSRYTSFNGVLWRKKAAALLLVDLSQKQLLVMMPINLRELNTVIT